MDLAGQAKNHARQGGAQYGEGVGWECMGPLFEEELFAFGYGLPRFRFPGALTWI